VSGSIHWRFVIKATPVLSSRVYISISWHKVAYPFYPAVRCASERPTRIRQAIPSRTSFLVQRDNAARKLRSILLRLTESDGLLPRKVYFYCSGVIIKFSKVHAIFKGRGMRMVLNKMKGIKLKVHFIVGNDIERSEYTANNLKKSLCIIPRVHNMGSTRTLPKY